MCEDHLGKYGRGKLLGNTIFSQIRSSSKVEQFSNFFSTKTKTKHLLVDVIAASVAANQQQSILLTLLQHCDKFLLPFCPCLDSHVTISFIWPIDRPC